MNIVLGGITNGCLTLGGYLGKSYLKQKGPGFLRERLCHENK